MWIERTFKQRQTGVLFTHHLDIGYDVIGVKADLVVSLGLVVVEGDGSDASPTLFTTIKLV